jgi:HprK-related kinase A
MLTVSALTPRQLKERLSNGMLLRTGPFTTRMQTSIVSLVDAIALLYADYPVHDSGFADFHVRVDRVPNLRRWIAPQVEFLHDGDSLFSPLPLSQAFPMLEWGLNWCISSRVNNHLILHAAVVERNGAAAILAAPSGSGKSTLCAALIHDGWRLLSDELAVIRPADGMLVPVPRPVSLKNDAINVVRAAVPGATISRSVTATLKGTVAHLKAPADSVARAAELARPAFIIFPQYRNGASPSLVPVAGAPAFLRLVENAFNYGVLGAKGFEAMAGVVKCSKSYEYTYSKLDDAIATFAALAERPA